MGIHDKLLAFQKLGITLKKDGINPHFGNSYVTLNEVLEKVKKPLNDAGILIIQKGGTDKDGAHGLYTTLYDVESDTEISAFMPYYGATDSQKLGGANTYLRRYSLITLLGLEDEDDDGESAVSRAKGKKTTGVQDMTEPPFKI